MSILEPLESGNWDAPYDSCDELESIKPFKRKMRMPQPLEYGIGQMGCRRFQKYARMGGEKGVVGRFLAKKIQNARIDLWHVVFPALFHLRSRIDAFDNFEQMGAGEIVDSLKKEMEKFTEVVKDLGPALEKLRVDFNF